MVNLKNTEDIINEIKSTLKNIHPDLSISVQHGFNVFHCTGFIEHNFQIDKREWITCYNRSAQIYLARERLLDSLIKTHKQLRIEIERIMYGNR